MSQCKKNKLLSKNKPIRFRLDDLKGDFYCDWDTSNSMIRLVGTICIAVFTAALMICGLAMRRAAKKTRVLTTVVLAVLTALALGTTGAACYFDMSDISKSRRFCTGDMLKTLDFVKQPTKVSCHYEMYLLVFGLEICACAVGLISLVCTVIARATDKRRGSERDPLIKKSGGRRKKKVVNIADYDYGSRDDFDFEQKSRERMPTSSKKKGKKKAGGKKGKKGGATAAEDGMYDFENGSPFEDPQAADEKKSGKNKKKDGVQHSTNPFEDDEPPQEDDKEKQQKPADEKDAKGHSPDIRSPTKDGETHTEDAPARSETVKGPEVLQDGTVNFESGGAETIEELPRKQQQQQQEEEEQQRHKPMLQAPPKQQQQEPQVRQRQHSMPPPVRAAQKQHKSSNIEVKQGSQQGFSPASSGVSQMRESAGKKQFPFPTTVKKSAPQNLPSAYVSRSDVPESTPLPEGIFGGDQDGSLDNTPSPMYSSSSKSFFKKKSINY